MCDGIKLVCNEAGEWEKYDDTWDITIHCRDERENEKIRAILTNLNLSGWIATKDKLPRNLRRFYARSETRPLQEAKPIFLDRRIMGAGS